MAFRRFFYYLFRDWFGVHLLGILRLYRRRCGPELLQDPTIDVIAIATPVSTHFRLALGPIESGEDILIGKPLAATSDIANNADTYHALMSHLALVVSTRGTGLQLLHLA